MEDPDKKESNVSSLKINFSSTGCQLLVKSNNCDEIDTKTPRSIQELELIRIIGTGTFARVWLCRRRAPQISLQRTQMQSTPSKAPIAGAPSRSKSVPNLRAEHATRETNIPLKIKRSQSCSALRTREFNVPSGRGSHDEEKDVEQVYYALKVMRVAEMIRLRQVDHVLNERSILSVVHHPFIARLYAF